MWCVRARVSLTSDGAPFRPTASSRGGRAVVFFALWRGRRPAWWRAAWCAWRRDTGAYVVTGFIDLREQRRTCARARMSSSALLAANGGFSAVTAGVPAQRFCCPVSLIFS